jgi:hypothetical protein
MISVNKFYLVLNYKVNLKRQLNVLGRDGSKNIDHIRLIYSQIISNRNKFRSNQIDPLNQIKF